MSERWNVIADNWTNGRYCLGLDVHSKEEAEKWAEIYRRKYEGKPYPNGKGYFTCRNFRAVERGQTDASGELPELQ